MTTTLRHAKLAAAGGSLAALALAAVLFLPRHATVAPTAPASRPASASTSAPLAGSQSCRSCHAVFFQKWSTSFHGLAMQPHTGDFARDRLTPQEKPLTIGGRRYRAVVGTGRRPRRGDGPAGPQDAPDRPGPRRQERLLLPDAARARPPAGAARRLRREPQGVVLDRRQRGAPLRRRHERGARLDGPRVHVQHLLLQLPREPARDELRARDRLLPHRLGGAGRLVRDLPRSGRRAREGVRGPGARRQAEGLEDRLGEGALEGPAQRPLRLVPRQGEPAVDRLPPGRSLLRPLRPDDAREPRLPPGRSRPRRELHAHVVAHEPLREVRRHRLRPLPHVERPLQVQGPAERRLPARATTRG